MLMALQRPLSLRAETSAMCRMHALLLHRLRAIVYVFTERKDGTTETKQKMQAHRL